MEWFTFACMKISESVIKAQTERVRNSFCYWEKYMEDYLEFWKIPGDLDIHTQGHCERVLMHALRIGDARHVSDEQMLALSLASIFHDTRRKDNYLDTGHGARAAEYYKKFASSEDETHRPVPFLPSAYAAIWYHDRDDSLGEKYIRKHFEDEDDFKRAIEVYHIFKDADGLDRLRLGTWCLDSKFLRTNEAKGMIPFAQQLVEASIPHDELMKTYKLTEPFKPD